MKNRKIYIVCLLLTWMYVSCSLEGKHNELVEFEKYGTGTQAIILVGGLIGKNNDYLKEVAQKLTKFNTSVYVPNFYSTTKKKRTFAEVSINQFINDIENLRKHQKIEKLILIGHSFGGTLSLIYSSKHPKHVSSLLLLNPGFIDSKKYNRGENSAFNKLIEPKDSSFLFFESFMKGEISDIVFHNKIDSIQINNLIYKNSVSDSIWNEVKLSKVSAGYEERVYFDMIRNPFDLTKKLNSIHTNVIIFSGEYDNYSKNNSMQLAKKLENANSVIISNSGHFPWFENPDEFYSKLYKVVHTGSSIN